MEIGVNHTGVTPFSTMTTLTNYLLGGCRSILHTYIKGVRVENAYELISCIKIIEMDEEEEIITSI